MHCNNEDLVMYVYDELEPERRSEVEQHLAACITCAREAEALRTTAAAVRNGVPLPEPSPELEERIRLRATALIRRPAPLWKRLFSLPRTSPVRTVLMSGAAAVLLVAALLVRQPADTSTADVSSAWHEAFYTELVRLAAGTTDTSTTGDAVLDQLHTDLNQLSMALASY